MIKITNFQNFDTICYSLPLITGEVIGVNNGEIGVKHEGKGTVYTKWPVVNGKFKILFNLVPGKNSIIFKCNAYTKQISLSYKPLKLKRFIRLVYIVCSDDDGTFQAPPDETNTKESACARLSLGAQMLQMFTAEKLKSHNLECKTFCLEEDDSGHPVCHVFKSSLHLQEALKLSETELWEHFALELMKSHLRVENDCKFLGVLSFTRYINSSSTIPKSFKDIKAMTQGYVALATGGLALLGSACLHTWPQNLAEVSWRFGDSRKMDRMHYMDDSGNRGWHWTCYSTTLGAMMHELGHIFNLGHTADGIMSRGFDNMHKFFIVDLFYCSHPFQKKNNPYYQKSIHEKENPVVFSKSSNISWTSNQPLAKNRESYANIKAETRTASSKKRSPLNISKQNDSNKPPWRIPDPPEDFHTIGASEPFWTRSSALILYYHKWFNDYKDDDEDSGCITRLGTTFSSSHGIRIIEFRDHEGTAFHHTEFLENDGSLSIDVALCQIKHCMPPDSNTVVVFVEDSHGHICQHTYDSELFINGRV